MNWGKGITLFMIAFIGFIGSMVYHAFTKNADLVSEDYYEREATYDQDKMNRQNYLQSGEKITVMQNSEGVMFHFPASVNPSTKGSIVFYRPDQQKLDREFALAANEDHEQTLPYSHFKAGYYDIRIDWNDGERGYQFQHAITF